MRKPSLIPAVGPQAFAIANNQFARSTGSWPVEVAASRRRQTTKTCHRACRASITPRLYLCRGKTRGGKIQAYVDGECLKHIAETAGAVS
jgi:hypothetical protein